MTKERKKKKKKKEEEEKNKEKKKRRNYLTASLTAISPVSTFPRMDILSSLELP